jgi:hypothetical protein
MDVEPPSYGILEQRTLADAFDGHVEEIDVLGYTILDSGLAPGKLQQIRDRLDGLLAGVSAGDGPAFRPDRDLVRCPLAHDDLFLEVATLPGIVELSRRVLGDTFVLLQQNAILNQPSREQHQSRWHRDLPYQHFVSSRKLAINALLAVDDFTFETGGTVVLPGSHMFEAFPSERLVRRHETTVEARAGDVILMDSMLFHRAGENISSGVRRGVNHLIGRPLLVQQMDIPRMLDGRHADDPFLNAYLGYRWNPAPDVATWQAKRV